MNEETASNIEVLGEVRRDPSSVLRVSVGELRGQTYVYLQTWERDEQDPGAGTPTRRGLTMRPDTLRGGRMALISKVKLITITS